ncbi:nitrate- and nitrite sensing domain-containing protein [Catenovulum sp. 2E275]|uniref:nitrate- and nitrite sensing domain-containing protein n=1 Tax=Catenovulum sp. 2E275 TaxID=2980497 RepID=UPI0021D07D29|nr:nitrate- and nitrite sensing domain-containing protein [Catenovulum sp. 2E275]MCU4674871.1 nitrate- and nitrite sensing domain-containing protein [Catenovulum sp. 2E275]
MSQAILISVIAGLIFLAIAVAFIRHQSLKTKLEIKQGLTAIVEVRDLVVLVQKHRGWSAALANGDTNVNRKIIELNQNIKNKNSELEKKYTLYQYDRWQAYIEHWQRLSFNSFSLSANDNFKQHTQLVGCMLYLLEDIAQHYSLTEELAEKSQTDKMMWRDLLHLSEFVGQARALGTGMATLHSSDRVERNKLIYLRHQITELGEEIYQKLAERGLDTEQSTVVANASKQTRYLCSAMEHELIETNKIVLDRDIYFNLATKTIESVNLIFDSELKRIQAHFLD